jgi:hypothetical protein
MVAVLSLSNLLYPATTTNAAPNPIEIISITESSSTSVEILFDSNIPKGQLSYYVISATINLSIIAPQSSKTQNVVAIAPKSIKKVIKTKATGLITSQIKNLNPKASYKFTVSAKTNKAKMINSKAVEYSPISNLMDLLSNLPADWGNPKPIQLPTPAPTTPPIAIPAFTLSSATEARTVNTAATGFTINSTGGAIANLAINATPPGMSFNATTGALTGTPNTVATATNYTITATNASGSATQTFRLTVTAVVYTVGQTGPGGGKVFYAATTPFSCGPTLAATCTYLEAVPFGWMTELDFKGDLVDVNRSWSEATPVDLQRGPFGTTGGTATAIGSGYQNTKAMFDVGNDDTAQSAGALAYAYTVTVSGVVYDDWYLPSKDELNQMCKWQRGITGEALTNLATVCTGGIINSGVGAQGFDGDYWTSTEINDFTVRNQSSKTGEQKHIGKQEGGRVRPIRAF